MTISVISYKGGVGKSTVSQNLAVCMAHQGKSVCIIDADKNESSNSWQIQRSADLPGVPVFHAPDKDLLLKYISNSEPNYDYIIIDCPPAVEEITSRAVAKSHLCLIPVTPTGGSDISATRKFAEHIELLRARLDYNIPARFVINKFNPRINMHKAFMPALEADGEKYSIPLLPTYLGHRTAYGEANMFGCGVVELDDKKAEKEILELFGQINEILTEVNS